MSRSKIELVGVAVSAPEVRTTPAGTPVLRVEVNCGEGREVLKLAVVMAGADARAVGERIGAGATLRVIGTLRAVHGGRWSSAQSGAVEVLASAISEFAADAVL
jgi:primosomal replication protein N